MLTTESIQAIVLEALTNTNEENGPDNQFEIGKETRLFGTDAVLNSLSLVSVIIDVETMVSERVGHDICLTDDRAMSQENSPFGDVSSLVAYVELLISELR